jgi:GntR family transcriptional regulator
MTFSQEMRRAGRVPSSRILTRALRPASSAEAADLGIAAGEPVVHLRRLRQADGEPIALESAVLVGACADAVMHADLANGSLHETLGRAGIVLRRGTATITAASATTDDARLLAIGVGDPLLVERRIIADRHGHPIEATESRYPAERYGLDVQFDVEGPDAGTGDLATSPGDATARPVLRGSPAMNGSGE